MKTLTLNTNPSVRFYGHDRITSVKGETVDTIKTWTDGFGTWHAAVPLTNGDEANTAKLLIIDELAQRGDASFAAEHMRVEFKQITNYGMVIFREAWDTDVSPEEEDEEN